MTDAYQEHPGRDHDLIERFVLNRLSPDEHLAIDAHIRGCASCRQAVETEREIAAGVRLAGRDDLKTRLQERLAETGHSRFPWARVVSVAAVIGIVTLVGVENNWFASRNMQPSSSPTSGQESVNSPRVAARPNESAPVSPPERDIHVSRDEKKADLATRQDRLATKKLTAEEAPADFRVSPAPQVSSEQNRMEEVQVSSGVNRPETWVEGIVLDTESPGSPALKDASKMKKIGTADAAESRSARLMLSKGEITPAVTLSQAPFRALSIQQQRIQQQQTRTIPTRVEQTPHGIHLTLYPESPFDSSALARARIESIVGDSLVITMPGQRIGLRLPEGWQATRK